jgi:hypothetical protein
VDVPGLVQDTTRRIVELIKVLIEYSTAKDVQGMQITVNTIYNEILEMVGSIAKMVSSVSSVLRIVLFANVTIVSYFGFSERKHQQEVYSIP